MVVDGGAAVASRPSTSRRRAAATAKPRAVVASRYLLPSSRPASPAAATRPAATRRPATMAADAAARAVSVAFQDASYCLDGGKAKQVPHAPSPEKKRASFAAGAAAVRAKVCDARWPASAAAANSAPYGFRGGVATRSVAFDEMTPRRASVDVPNPLRAALSSDDTESATSSAGSPDGDADADAKLAARARPSPRSIMASPARFSRDAMGSRSERFADHSTPFMSRTPRFLASPSPKTTPTAPPPPTTTKKKSVKSLFNGLLSSPFTRPSPKQPPPTKPAAISPASPSPARCSATAAASAVPGRLQAQGKAEEEHQLRLLHNRHLQWRLANAVAGAAISAQELNAEKQLCGAWVSILGMSKSIALKKLELQLLRQNCKVMNTLKGQMAYLEEWSLLENKYANSLSGTVEALNATVLRLPVSDGAVADFQSVKNAVGSAVDVMQTMRNSMSYLLPKLARTNVLVSQLSIITRQEQVLMAQCRELLSTLALMHVKYSSLQGQMIQLSDLKRAKSVSSSEYPY
ncbi:QWRF motif-containing protein 2 [Oryza sativa Japonica Group]|uniref:Os07g0115600 protein n=2 Tax=Oryza sativa subsp. japonica TaxID=39947 RepID=Q8H2N8_ORYSJ|nr:QWRF motif-containing protein 2 [Oryza sativa Japonica Group]KAB8104121.1 hypothetical protein EE612_036795 [Oryza sativa]KAF2921191.1 hypothetical protein DAI22_07g011800 [Oryza sativa Japonica Group]BAC16196.1 proteophosphoglycan-like [Oryza sativa Japonica Group]BAS99802.1 Os07g0115600 [Oryza sativa Japonica Group]